MNNVIHNLDKCLRQTQENMFDLVKRILTETGLEIKKNVKSP